MKYGKVRFEDSNLIYSRHMMSYSLPCTDILWAYRRKEENKKKIPETDAVKENSLVLITRKKKRYQFFMSEEEALLCISRLKEINPYIATGYPKGSRIPLQSLPNTRDLGAFKTVDGKFVLPHRLIRSGELYHLSNADQKILSQEYHVSEVIDLRTSAERKEKPDTQMAGVMYCWNPVFDEETAEIARVGSLREVAVHLTEDPDGYMEDTYRMMVTDPYSLDQYAEFFDRLLHHKEGAVLWHCGVGKDRTGVAAALVLSALGVPRNSIYEDYLRSNLYLQEEEKFFMHYLEMQRKVSKDRLQNASILFQVKKNYLAAAFSSIEEKYGSMEYFFRKRMYLTAKSFEELHKKYLT